MNRANRYTRQVVQELIGQMQGDVSSIEAIAKTLLISVRQLQSEGTSFQTLVDQTRKELVLRHLQNSETPVHDIAFLLGFLNWAHFYEF